jgi:hypothetical protein
MGSLLVSASTVVDAPASVVFDIVADPRQHPRIDGSGSVRGSVSGPERLSLGAHFSMDMKLGAPYKIGNTVVEFEEDRRIAWRHFGAHRWRYELEELPAAEGGGTRVTETWDATRYNAVRTAAMKAAGFPERNRRGIEATLVRLKEAAEADARAGTDEGIDA